MQALPKKMLIALGAAASAIVGVELYLRFASPVAFLDPEVPVGSEMPLVHRHSATPGLDYELVPGVEAEVGGVTVRANSHGMRDDEPLAGDTPGLHRIAVLGDSIGFGWRVPVEACFAARLEQLLATASTSPAVTYDVLNFSVTGYSTRDESYLLAGRVLEYAPERIVIGYCLNDPSAGPQQALPRYFAATPAWQHSHLLRLLAKRRHDRRVARLGDGDFYRYLHAPDGPEWPTVLEGFARIRDAVAPHGIPVLLVIFPWPQVDTWAEYPHRELHAQVAAAAAAHGFQVLDLLEAFSAHPPFDVVFSASDPHPTELGHDVTARAIAAQLRADGLP